MSLRTKIERAEGAVMVQVTVMIRTVEVNLRIEYRLNMDVTFSELSKLL
jgi:hypothetical protein